MSGRSSKPKLTVKELISLLEKVEDKDLKVCVGTNSAWNNQGWAHDFKVEKDCVSITHDAWGNTNAFTHGVP